MKPRSGLPQPTREFVLAGEEPPAVLPSKPNVLYAIIAINFVVYAITASGTGFIQSTVDWIARLGFVPAELLANPFSLYKIFTAMFTHADIMHIAFNMYFLYIFGRAVERALGGVRFLALYLLSGVAAAIFHTIFMYIQSPAGLAVPSVGASGAISGVLGAYMLMFPGTRLTTCFFLFFMPVCFEMLAAYYLLFWFSLQVIEGYVALNSRVAFFAHAGGFLAGVALLPLVADRKKISILRLLSRSQVLFGIIRILPIRRQGLSPMAKSLFAALTTLLLAGTVLSYMLSANNPSLALRYTASWELEKGPSGLDHIYAIIELNNLNTYVLSSTTTSIPGRIVAAVLDKMGVVAGPEDRTAPHAPVRLSIVVPYTLYTAVRVNVVLTDIDVSYTRIGGVNVLQHARLEGAIVSSLGSGFLQADVGLDAAGEAARLLSYMSLAAIATLMAALYTVLYRDVDYVITPETL